MKRSEMKTGYSVKKAILTVLVLIPVLCSFCFNAEAYKSWESFDTSDGLEADYTDSTPKLDGVQEEMWNNASFIDISFKTGENQEGPSYATGKMKLMWNESFLFLFCEVTDENVCESESVGADNDCLEFLLFENPSNGALTSPDEADPTKGNLKFYLYNSYKADKFGETINSNLRDYVAAECKKTDKGYNLEAIIKLSRRAILGDTLFIDARLHSISETNGALETTSGLKESGLSKLYLTNNQKRMAREDGQISVLSLDMSYGYTQERLDDLFQRFEPDVVCAQKTDSDKLEALKTAFDKYEVISYEDSCIVMLYNVDRVNVMGKGKAGSKSDCIWAYFKMAENGNAFYLYGMWLDDFGGAVRRAQASEIKAHMLAENKFSYPVLFCGNINSRENSFTYDIFGEHDVQDIKILSRDYVPADEGTVYMFATVNSFSIDVCRAVGTDGENAWDNLGGVFVKVKPSSGIDSEYAKRKTIYYVIEGVITLLAGGALTFYLIKKSRKKKGGK